jgi:hypothetical protein
MYSKAFQAIPQGTARTIAHSEDIFLQCYSTQPYFPCCAESELSGRIPWHACEVRPMDSWAVSPCKRLF